MIAFALPLPPGPHTSHHSSCIRLQQCARCCQKQSNRPGPREKCPRAMSTISLDYWYSKICKHKTSQHVCTLGGSHLRAMLSIRSFVMLDQRKMAPHSCMLHPFRPLNNPACAHEGMNPCPCTSPSRSKSCPPLLYAPHTHHGNATAPQQCQ